MSPSVLRWCAVPLGLLGFALRMAVTFWLQPQTWGLGSPSRLLVLLGGVVAAAAIPFGIFMLLGVGNLRRPARFAMAGGRFIAPSSPVYAGSQAMMWMFLSGNFVFAERVPNADRMRMADLGWAWPATIVGVGAFWAVAAAFVLVQRPQVHLDPAGVSIRRVRRTTTIAWDELAPGGPCPPGRRRARHLRLRLLRAPVLGRYAASADVPIGWLHIDPAFLAHTIRHYVEHPQDRAAIGTEDGLRRLHVPAPAPVRDRPGAAGEDGAVVKADGPMIV